MHPSRLGANKVAGVEISEWDLGQVPNESSTMRQDAIMHWASNLAHSKCRPVLLALISSDTGEQMWAERGRSWKVSSGPPRGPGI